MAKVSQTPRDTLIDFNVCHAVRMLFSSPTGKSGCEYMMSYVYGARFFCSSAVFTGGACVLV